MNGRSFAGLFDPEGRAGPDAQAVFDSGRSFVSGPLRVAYTGDEIDARAGERWCLLDGRLDRIEGEGPDGGAAPVEDRLASGLASSGPGLVERLRGEFAFVAWDPDAEGLMLARDRLGARSIFLHERDRVLYFASEIGPLLRMLPARPGVEPLGVAAWVAGVGRPGDSTLYRGVRRLLPAHLLLCDRAGIRERRYWSARYVDPELAPEELTARVRAALETSVARRMDAADGATGVLMSGGLDSAGVASLCTVAGRGPVHACSAVFPDHPRVDEAELIATMTREFDLLPTGVEVRAGGMIAAALDHQRRWGLPLASWGDGWAAELLRRGREAGVRTVLDGEGGDEVFAPRTYLFADEVLAGRPREAYRLLKRMPGWTPRVGRRALANSARELAAGMVPAGLDAPLRARVAARELPAWLRPGPRAELLAARDPVAWKRLDGPRWWAYCTNVLLTGLEEHAMFESRRRRAASLGLETAHPLLDPDLVELCLNADPRASLDPRFNRPLLREALAGLLPDPVRLRPHKALFDSFMVDSLAGSDGAAVARLLGDLGAELGAYVDLPAMRAELLGPGLREAEPFTWMIRVWRAATAELWLRAEAGRSETLTNLFPP